MRECAQEVEPQLNRTWNDRFQRMYEEQSPHLDVLCATLDPLAYMQLRKGLMSKDHEERGRQGCSPC